MERLPAPDTRRFIFLYELFSSFTLDSVSGDHFSMDEVEMGMVI
jgi:hypothetical protein